MTKENGIITSTNGYNVKSSYLTKDFYDEKPIDKLEFLKAFEKPSLIPQIQTKSSIVKRG